AVVALEGGDEVREPDAPAGRLEVVALGRRPEGLTGDPLVVHPVDGRAADAGEEVGGGRVEAEFAVLEGVLEDEAEVAVVPDVEAVVARHLGTAVPHLAR